MRVVLLVNIPAPYRVPVYDRLAERMGRDFRVVYMAELEANRKWQVPVLRHEHTVLRGHTLSLRDRAIHLRTGVWRALSAFRPDVVITGGFNPPMLSAWLYATAFRRAHIAISDAWIHSEAELSVAHRFVRSCVFTTSAAFIGASDKTLELFRSYGVTKNLFRAPLGVDNGRFGAVAGVISDRPYDVVFSGNLIDRKLPLFFVDVVEQLARRRAGLSVLVIGDGELRTSMEQALSRISGIQVTFTGYLQQTDLPAAYASGKVFCFPTKNDPWGVVANEACAAGMPVITCTNAGCAGELVVDGENGYVVPLDATTWADRIAEILGDSERLHEMSRRSTTAASAYTFDTACEAIISACRAVHP